MCCDACFILVLSISQHPHIARCSLKFCSVRIVVRYQLECNSACMRCWCLCLGLASASAARVELHSSTSAITCRTMFVEVGEYFYHNALSAGRCFGCGALLLNVVLLILCEAWRWLHCRVGWNTSTSFQSTIMTASMEMFSTDRQYQVTVECLEVSKSSSH